MVFCVIHDREKQERLNLNLLVKDVIDNITPLDRIKITIENELPDVLRDSVRMEQVFQNLIGNAIKFMDKRDGIIKVGCVDEGAFWKFSVSEKKEKNMRSSKPILLIEDDQVDAMTVKRALKDIKVTNRLDIVHDGKEALTFLKNFERQKNPSSSCRR